MDNFQNYLDSALKKVDIQSEKPTFSSEDYDVYFEIAKQITNARSSLGMSQKELAIKSKLTQANISKIESGIIHPTIDSLIRIADALGMKLSINFYEDGGFSEYD